MILRGLRDPASHEDTRGGHCFADVRPVTGRSRQLRRRTGVILPLAPRATGPASMSAGPRPWPTVPEEKRCFSFEVRRNFAIVFAPVLLFAPRAAMAQFDAATVLGTVVDATGAVIPGATVTLKNAETGITATAVTDSAGNFQFLNVRVGTYGLRSELQDLGRHRREHPGHGQCAPARRLDDESGGHRRDRGVTGAARLLESEVERSRAGHRPRADRQPAAQRAQLRRPGAAQPRHAVLD